MASNGGSTAMQNVAVTGGVDITGFPQLLLTKESGDPDTLLPALLKGARAALEASKSLIASGHGSQQPGLMAALHLATALLKDSNFTVGSKGSQPHLQNYYRVDLEAETIRLRTWLFATNSKRTSTFLVNISGNVKTGKFTVERGGDDGNVMAEFDEKRMEQPEFVSRVLAEECLRKQMSKEHFKQFGDLPTVQTETGVRVNLAVANGTRQIYLRKNGAAESWEVIDEQTSEKFGALPSEMVEHVEEFLKGLGKILQK
jgi:hypothetical protein